MNNKHLSWNKEINNNFIIASRAYFLHFTIVYSNPSAFDTGSVAMSSKSKLELQNEQQLVKGEVTMCVGSDSKVDKITIAHSLYLRD